MSFEEAVLDVYAVRGPGNLVVDIDAREIIVR